MRAVAEGPFGHPGSIESPSPDGPPAEGRAPEAAVAVGRGLDAEALQEEVLLLSALGIPHALVPSGDEIDLVVPGELEARARKELATLAEEEDAAIPAPAMRGGARAGVPAAIVLLFGHFLLQRLPAALHARILGAGELDAARVQGGEIFRVFTALSLHADLAHVLGNAVATAIFVSAVGDWIGPGFALACAILAGALGNLGASFIDPGHHAIGFSTATFGALGLTAVFGFVARYRDRLERRRAWLALGAGVALLALLGAGERSDLLAHILGLLMGALIGLAVSGPKRALSRSAKLRNAIELGAVGQIGCALLAVALMAGAWGWALALR